MISIIWSADYSKMFYSGLSGNRLLRIHNGESPGKEKQNRRR